MAEIAARPDIDALQRRIEALAAAPRRTAGADRRLPERLSLGPAPIDAALGGGLALRALHEIAGDGARAFAAALVGRLTGPIVWIVHDRAAARLYPDGLSQAGLAPDRLLLVTAPAGEIPWAFEQVLRAGVAAAAVAEAASPSDFTRSRRLQLAARDGGGLALLATAADVHPHRRPHGRRPPASAADTRWRIVPSPVACAFCPEDAAEAGSWPNPRYRAELQKNKRGSTGAWEIEWHAPTHRFHLAAPV